MTYFSSRENSEQENEPHGGEKAGAFCNQIDLHAYPKTHNLGLFLSLVVSPTSDGTRVLLELSRCFRGPDAA